MRAGFIDETVHEIALSAANQKRLERLARARGVSPAEFLQSGMDMMLEQGQILPPKEGRVVPFEALNRDPSHD